MPVTMIRTSAFLPLILPHCPECPDFVAETQARLAAIEFCERSRAWRHLTTVPLVASEGVLVAPEAAAIHEIEYARFNGRKLTPVQFSTISTIAQGVPEYVTQVSPGAVTVSPFIEPGDLEVSLFLKPMASSEFGTLADDPLADRFNVVPDFLVSVHGGAIALGALARILSIPRQPWTVYINALKYEARFNEKLGASFRANMRGQQRAPVRTSSRWF